MGRTTIMPRYAARERRLTRSGPISNADDAEIGTMGIDDHYLYCERWLSAGPFQLTPEVGLCRMALIVEPLYLA